MKVKIISLFLVVLVAQAHVAQASPAPLLNLNIGGTLTGIVSNTLTTVINTALSLLSHLLAGITQTLSTIQASVTTGINTLANTASQLPSNIEGQLQGMTDITAIAGTGLGNIINIGTELEQDIQSLGDKLAGDITGLIPDGNSVLSNPIPPIMQTLDGFTQNLQGLDAYTNIVGAIPQTADAVINAILPDESIPLPTREEIQALIEAEKAEIANVSAAVVDQVNQLANPANQISNNIGSLLGSASNVLNDIKTQISTGASSPTSTVFPLTSTAIKTAVTSAKNIANTVAAGLTSKVAALQNLAGTVPGNIGASIQNIIADIANVASACSDAILSGSANVASNAATSAINCFTNEINTINACLVQFQNLGIQFQVSSTTNSINVSTLKQTIESAVKCKIDIVSADVKLKACLAVSLVNSANALLPAGQAALQCVRTN